MSGLALEIPRLAAEAAEHKRLSRHHRRKAAQTMERLRKAIALAEAQGIEVRISGQAPEESP